MKDEDKMTMSEFIDYQIEMGINLQRLPIDFVLSKEARDDLLQSTKIGTLDENRLRVINFLSGYYYGAKSSLSEIKEIVN